MDAMIMLSGYAIAVIIAGLAAVMLQRKGKASKREFERAGELIGKVTLLEKELSDSKEILAQKEQELQAAVQERDEKASALETLENDFESKMDEVVESSIQKISHAEQAKEDAVQAAEDNYEAAAEAHATIKEKEKIIADLQKQLDG